jgi:putative oxygen-independent coproporphyrinogen III oxidase
VNTSRIDVSALHRRAGALTLAALPPLALYVHLPWCLKKCPYCDFNSHELTPKLSSVATSRGGSLRTGQPGSGAGLALDAGLERRYLASLRADLEVALPLVWGRRVVSVFIGGGTPSLFSPEAIGELLADVRARLPLEPGCEITLEANPGTFERERFRAFREAGVTRLSIGVQSFDNAKLRALGRVHDRAQAIAAIEEAQQAFESINIDLMYALPGQTLADCEADVRQALAFEPPHFSIYHLTLEPNTRFALKPPPGLPDDDLAFAMLDCITELTGVVGLDRYEISAFARRGHRCRHNLNYWQFGDYLGIGAGAHSKLSFAHRILRQTRWREPAAYLDKALEGGAVSSEQEVAAAELPFEFMLNALRLREGFELARFSERTGLPVTVLASALERAEARGLLERDLHRAWPTERGFDFLSDLQALFLV